MSLSSPWAWAALAALLLLQNFSFTVVSRARNSGSDIFHAIAAVFSNGVWVLVQVGLFAQWMEVWKTGSGRLLAATASFYVLFTVVGSILGGKVSRRYFEKGNRRVGHYEDEKARLDRLESVLGRVTNNVHQVAQALYVHDGRLNEIAVATNAVIDHIPFEESKRKIRERVAAFHQEAAPAAGSES